MSNLDIHFTPAWFWIWR